MVSTHLKHRKDQVLKVNLFLINYLNIKQLKSKK
jgi:hypothetical protein